jgi:hypothetical protein
MKMRSAGVDAFKLPLCSGDFAGRRGYSRTNELRLQARLWGGISGLHWLHVAELQQCGATVLQRLEPMVA